MKNVNWAKMARIEAAEQSNPVCCDCGEWVASVAKSDGIWLECLSLQRPERNSFLARLWANLNVAGHTRAILIDNRDFAA